MPLQLLVILSLLFIWACQHDISDSSSAFLDLLYTTRNTKSSTGRRETIQKMDRLIYLGHTIVITVSSLIERAAKFFKFSKIIPADCCNIHLNVES